MSITLQLARPMMRRSAGLDANQTRRQLLKERQNVAPPQLTADNHLAFRINAMDLKHRLGDVETDSRNRLHVGSSETWVLNNTHFDGTRVPVEEPSTASVSDLRRALAVSSFCYSVLAEGCMISEAYVLSFS
jgi:hypothetical protein